ncbi:F-box protein At1g67340-like [Cornus florida]|uniref:F-box protein At1g67340-like n=1 Tax=Cornus florida TaxID=4283 RepID=UPI00289EE22C|nr:F-box protein At1g67340-like [Cornus florida]
MMSQTKKPRTSIERSDLFDVLPDDILIFILSKLSSTARCPSDFINVLVTCKRLNRLALNPLVLSLTGPKTFSFRAQNWSESAHRFLKLCISAGNTEASYTLGMIRFYCLQNRGSGLSLIAKAAIKAHAPALYSLAVIQFNGSGGGSKTAKDLRAGVALCARAAYLGHIDSLRELGHCFQDGYGVRRNVSEGRRLLIQANALEIASIIRAVVAASHSRNEPQPNVAALCSGVGMGLLSDLGCHVPSREVHPVNMFLTEWFGSRGGEPGLDLRMCSHSGCGRPETRRNEFRRCSVCGKVNYCSRGCQALDWKLRHKAECAPLLLDQWMEDVDGHDHDGDQVVEDGDAVGGPI